MRASNARKVALSSHLCGFEVFIGPYRECDDQNYTNRIEHKQPDRQSQVRRRVTIENGLYLHENQIAEQARHYCVKQKTAD